MEFTKIIEHEGGKYVVDRNHNLKAVGEWFGTSDKPFPTDETGVRNADFLYLIDTKEIFIYDGEKKEWVKQ